VAGKWREEGDGPPPVQDAERPSGAHAAEVDAQVLAEVPDVDAVVHVAHGSTSRIRPGIEAAGSRIATNAHRINQGRMPKRFGLDPIRDVQVLCPMNRGGLGARSVDLELLRVLNPPGEKRVERFVASFTVST